VLACAGLVLASCAPEEKVIRYKPFFAGLDGVQTQTPAVYEKNVAIVGKDGKEETAEESLVVTTPDGKKKLISRTGAQLMHHIQDLLAKDDPDLFADQVLSKTTRDEYVQRGLDPREAFATLKPHEKDIAKLFARMPMAEHSPNVLMESLGGNTFRVRLTGPSTRGLDPWTGFDMVLENGNYKLRWFV
jgi:hypothetical protein